MNDYLFGTLQGPFQNGINLINQIKEQHNLQSVNCSIIKLGVCIYRKFDLQLRKEPYENYSSLLESESYDVDTMKLMQTTYFMVIDNKNYQIGKTGILEFEDVNITSAAFSQDMDDSVYVNYIIRINT